MASAETQDSFGIEQLFGSKTRARLLQLMLKNPTEQYYVRELTRVIDAQLNSVRRELNNLVALGIIQEVDSEDVEDKSDRKKYYQVNTDFELYEELRALFTKASVMIQQDMIRSIIAGQAIQVLVLTGFFTGARVETDMLIVGSPDAKVLQERIQSFEQLIGQEVNYTVMPTEEYLYRRDISDRFLHSILDSDIIEIHNTL